MPTPRVILLTGLIVAAAMSRLLPHPQNMAPITALALFAAAHLPSRRLGFGLPLAAMLLSDVVLYATKDAGYREYAVSTMFWVYLALIAIAAIGQRLRGRLGAVTIIGTTLVGSVLFFVVTNFGAWVSLTEFYPRTLGGLLDCYIAGLPFFRGTLLGDLVYSGLLFGGFALLERVVPQVRVTHGAI